MNHDDYKLFAVPIHTAAGKPATWHPAIDAHCLLVGGTPEERAALTGAVTAEFAEAGWSVQRGDSAEKQREIITDTWVLMEQRYVQLMNDPTAREMLEPILLVVDEEYGGLTRTPAALTFTTDQVRDLLSLARSAKIHVLVCASSPSPELLTAETRDNLAVRVPGDAASRDHQLMRA